MKLEFLGATETVTGSKFLVEAAGKRILVDCGLFQGLKELRLRNREAFPVDPHTIDIVVLTHAHIDHSGFLPALIKQGYGGRIICTQGTRDLCAVLLPDAGFLQEEEAEYFNRHEISKHKPAAPLYTAKDARDALNAFSPVAYDETHTLAPGITVRFTPAGHILGAACVHLQAEGKTLVFSGDIGRLNDLVMRPPQPIDHADFLVLESTYGNRKHEAEDPGEALAAVINRTAQRGGIVIIPAFAVGRAQTLLYLISELKRAKRIPEALPVYLNSPMANDVTRLYCNHVADLRLPLDACRKLGTGAKQVASAEESKALNDAKGPMVIVSASGMASGGRVVHHIKALGPDARNTLLFCGYQAAGTRGEALVSGSREIKIHGEYVPIRAEVAKIDSLSAHADYSELISWLRSLRQAPKRVFLVHGEPAAQDAFRRHLGDFLGWRQVAIPKYREAVTL